MKTNDKLKNSDKPIDCGHKLSNPHRLTNCSNEFTNSDKFKDIMLKDYNNGHQNKGESLDRSNQLITDFDLHLFNEGNHHKIYEKLGAHHIAEGGQDGTYFAVWAPSATSVSVIGDFNGWTGKSHMMRQIKNSGVWELFIPHVLPGAMYKYSIETSCGAYIEKADPYAFYSELRPGTASIVYSLDNYTWHDQEWIAKRDSANNFDKPVSIYEVHLGSWARSEDGSGNFLTYRDYADKLISYVIDMGYTHIELLPLAEHPLDDSWGYQVTGYYSVTSRYGLPEDFMYLVDKCHEMGIGVIMDWVPGHFPKDAHGLAKFDGTALYEHADPRQGEQPDWGTLVFNYSRYEVRSFLISNAVFWFEKYHIDGIRADAVASMLYLDYGRKSGEWIPNKYGGNQNIAAADFLKQLNTAVFSHFPGIMMIAEESTSWPMITKPPHTGGLGFTYKWNMGWMNDYLKYVSMDPIYRKYQHNLITFSLMYAMNENFVLVLSHDEVVHGKRSMIEKMPGDYWQKFAGLRVTYGYMYGHPGKKLLFMGNEFGQFIEWNFKQGLDWNLLDYEMHNKLKRYVHDLNKLYTSENAMHQLDFSYDGFEWLDCNDSDHSIVSFMRKGSNPEDRLLFVCNFTPVVYSNYRIGVPEKGFYKEILNSDSEIYGGSNVGNLGGLEAEKQQYLQWPYSISIQVPPLAVVVFKPAQHKQPVENKHARQILSDGT